MEEIWREIGEYPGYAASNLGRIKRLASRDTYFQGSNEFVRTSREIILKPRFVDKYDKSLSVGVKYKNNYVTRKIHRLVGLAFLQSSDVTHVSDDKTDNSLSNLILCSEKKKQCGKNLKNLVLNASEDVVTKVDCVPLVELE